MYIFFLLLVSGLRFTYSYAPPIVRYCNKNKTTFERTRRYNFVQWTLLPENYQEMGNDLIYKAVRMCGLDDRTVNIQWKVGRVVVQLPPGDTVYYVTAPLDDNDDNIIDDEDEDNDDNIEDENANENDLDFENEVTEEGASTEDGVDLTTVARTINAAFDDDNVGSRIAETHEIEVSTPGASDELVGDIMFRAYKGFDVIVQHCNPKTYKVKQIDGRLVDRNDEFLVLNIKGRTKNLKLDEILSVKLPKAKKE